VRAIKFVVLGLGASEPQLGIVCPVLFNVCQTVEGKEANIRIDY